MGCGVFSLLLRGKSGASRSAPLVYPLTQWLGAAAGAGCAGVALCQPTEAFGRIPHPRSVAASAVRTWKSGHFGFCPRIFQSLFWCLGVACGVQSIGFLGRSCVFLGSTVDTCSTGGFGRIFHFFLRGGELES